MCVCVGGGGGGVCVRVIIIACRRNPADRTCLGCCFSGISKQDDYAVHSRKVSSYTRVLLFVTIMLGERNAIIRSSAWLMINNNFLSVHI